MPGFLASLADKAQSAINASPLAHRPASPEAADPHKSHTLGAIQNQLRAFGQQYASTTPVQKIITIEKSVAIDFDGVARDAKSQSKELYTWGQTEPEDLKDVTDRLAYLNFVQGSLASSLALKLDAARAPFKALRDAETAISPRRTIRAGLQTQLARVEHDQQKGFEKKIVELKDQIKKAELDDEAQEKEIELLKRKAVRESEQLKWEAFREYGEKLVLLSQASTPIVEALPTIPPSPNQPYTGAQVTGAARASLQRALDNYKTGHINLPTQLASADLHRSDTRSFGESHASELSSINSEVTHTSSPGLLTTPPSNYKAHATPPSPFKPSETHNADKSASPPINPAALNQSPTPIPAISPGSTTIPIPIPAAAPTSPSTVVPITPTLAETGVPVSAGARGPGPASGSLHDIRGAPPNAGARDDSAPVYGEIPTAQTGNPYPAAVDEKQRLESAYSQGSAPVASPSSQDKVTSPKFESAENEKKRLEREERERLLNTGTSASTQKETDKKDDDDLPPSYQAF
ncbi:hypothetical protein H0H87_003849 [Tephrocybe sp. NHM501043]|nr:hypothetical protein H0H87_003849 [Tephrocybe sp. NHM501043]